MAASVPFVRKAVSEMTMFLVFAACVISAVIGACIGIVVMVRADREVAGRR